MTQEGDHARGSDIETRLERFIQRELLGSESDLGRDDDLLSDGRLDSVAVIRLATFVADEFDFEIRPADFVIENFRTVAALARYVRRASGAAR